MERMENEASAGKPLERRLNNLEIMQMKTCFGRLHFCSFTVPCLYHMMSPWFLILVSQISSFCVHLIFFRVAHFNVHSRNPLY